MEANSIKTAAHNGPPLRTGYFWNRTGATLSKGHLAQVDILGASTEAQTHAAFNPASHKDEEHPFNNLVAVDAAGDDGGWIVVALESIADNAQGLCAISGVVDIMLAGSSAVAAGARIRAASGATTATAEADGLGVIGVAIDAGPTGTAAALGTCIFDGYGSLFGPQAEV